MANEKNATSTTAPTSTPATDKTPVQPEYVHVEITSKLRKRTKDGKMVDAVTLINPEVLEMVSSAFEVQDDIENESKFSRGFLADAVMTQTKAIITRAINDWTRLVDTSTRLHPTWTREECEEALLDSRKSRRIKEMHDAALELKAKL